MSARHKTTLEITKEDHLTPQGDCIIAVSADRGLTDFTEGFRKKLRSQDTLVRIKLSCENMREEITARGHPGLTLENPEEMVVRKSDFLCPRTLAIKADKAAIDLDRVFVDKLTGGALVEVEIILEDAG